MPRSNQQNNTTSAASNTSTHQVTASNQTVDAFLGGPRPAWMRNAQGSYAGQIEETQQHRTTKTHDPASKTAHTQVHFKVAPPSSITTTSNQDSVLPSPALTNEPSPADTTQNPSPVTSAGATVDFTGRQDHRQIEATHSTPRGSLANILHDVGTTTVLPSERLPRPTEVIVQPRQAEHRSNQDAHNQTLHPQRPVQSETRSLGTSLPSTNSLDTRLSADAEERRAKRARLESAPTVIACPVLSDTQQPQMRHPWVQQMDSYLHRCGGLDSLGSDLDRLRYQYLRQACVSNDVLYVFLHRLLCQWTVQPSVVLKDLPKVPMDTLREAMRLLQIILRSNQELTSQVICWFAAFPTEKLDQAFLLRDEISDFLIAFAQNWQGLLGSFTHRHVPLTAFELVTLLKCKSRTLQGTLFTVSRRTMEVLDTSAPVFNKLLAEDQASEERLAGNSGYTPADMRAVRADFVARYRTLVEEVRRQRLAEDSGQQNPASHHPGAQSTPSNVKGTRELQAPAISPAGSPQTPAYPVGQVMSVPSLAGHTGGGASHVSATPQQRNGQLAAPQAVPAPMILASNGPQQGPALPPGYVSSSSYGGHLAAAVGRSPALPSEHITHNRAWDHGTHPQNTHPNHHGRRVASVGPWPMATVPSPTPAPNSYQGAQPQPSQVSLPFQLSHTQRFHPPVAGPVLAQIQHQALTGHPSVAPTVASNTPRRPSVAGSQVEKRPTHRPVVPHLPPMSPHDWTSVQNGAHLPQLRSPKRRPMGSVISTSPHYQYLAGFAVKPIHLPPRSGLRRLEFTLCKADMEKVSRTTTEDLTGVPVCHYFEGSHRYRLRLCIVPEKEKDLVVKEGVWAVTPAHWPVEFYPTINEKPLLLGRKQHFRYDQPADISSYIMEGTNVIKVSFPDRPPNLQEGKVFFVAVEVIVTRRHDLVRSEILSSGHWPAGETVREIAKRLAPGDSDDVIVADNTLTLSTTDPFTLLAFETPVRGRDCRHLECFDLDIWLSSREGKPSNIKGQEPSLPDIWACPLCGMDARPSSLRIDSYMAYVRKELQAMGKGTTKQIVVKMDGRWEPVVEVDEDDDEAVVEHSLPVGASAQVTRMVTSDVVEILDD